MLGVARPTQIWGINIQRSVASTNEVSFLTPMPAALAFRGIYKFSSAATLTGIEVAESGTRLEIKPYGIADTTTDFSAIGPERPAPRATPGSTSSMASRRD